MNKKEKNLINSLIKFAFSNHFFFFCWTTKNKLYMKTMFKFPKRVMAVAGAAAMMFATCGVVLVSNSTVQAQSGGIWHGSEFCEEPGNFTCLPEVVVE